MARKVRKDAFVRARALHRLHRHPPLGKGTGSCPPGAPAVSGLRGFFTRPRSKPTDAALASLVKAERANRAAATTESALTALACLPAASFASSSAAPFPAQSRSASGPSAAAVARDLCALTQVAVRDSPALFRAPLRSLYHKSASREDAAVKCVGTPIWMASTTALQSPT